MYRLRGRRKDNGEWLYSRSIDDRGPGGVFMKHGEKWVEVYSWSIGKYITLCNDNTEEVYDGDLLQFIDGPNKNNFHVYYEGYDCCCKRKIWPPNPMLRSYILDVETLRRMKKIGNIFDWENKE